MTKSRATTDDLKSKGLTEVSPGVFQKAKKVQELGDCSKPEIANENQSQELIFKWAGKHVSLNTWYSGTHWTKKNKEIQVWHAFFKSYLTLPYPKFNKYRIELSYNSRLDPSNVVPMIKLCEDTLQGLGIIQNDTKEFCRGIFIVPDEAMKKFSYKITVINIP